MIALTAARLYTPLAQIERPLVLLDGRHIAQAGSRDSIAVPQAVRTVDFGDAVLAPGFVDIHIHGGAGHDVMEENPAGLLAMEQLLAKHGVTSYFPTTVTAPIDQTLAALDRLANAIEKATGSGAHPLGIHLEGPFISHTRRGVHPPESLLPPTISTFDRFWQASRGHIKVMTIAPELDGSREVIAEATRRGVCVSLGHSDADLSTTRAAVEAGAHHATHAFNAMRPFNHRDPGIVGAMLTDSRLSADIIADGIHVDPTVVELFLKAKGPDASVLITDATAATGMPDGRYRLGTFEVEVKHGMCTVEGKLAGSVLTMDRAVRNAMKFAGWNLQQALRAASMNPAKVMGLQQKGRIDAGCAADIVVLSPSGEVRASIIDGAVPDTAGKG